MTDLINNSNIKKKLLTVAGFWWSANAFLQRFLFSVLQTFERYAKHFHKKASVDLKGNLPFKRHGFNLNGDTNRHKRPNPMGAAA